MNQVTLSELRQRNYTKSEDSCLVPELFINQPKRKKRGRTFSMGLCESRKKVSTKGGMMDLAKLVNCEYPLKTYVQLLKLISTVPNIIMEEMQNKQVSKIVKTNQHRRYSQVIIDIQRREVDKHVKVDESINDKYKHNRETVSLHTTTSNSILTKNDVNSDQKDESINNLKSVHNSGKASKEQLISENHSKVYGNTEKPVVNPQQRDRKLRKDKLRMEKMNKYIEHQRNYLRLKKNLERYERRMSKREQINKSHSG